MDVKAVGRGIYLYQDTIDVQTIVEASAAVAALGGNDACMQYGNKPARILGMRNLVNCLCEFIIGKQLHDFLTVLPGEFRGLLLCTKVRYTGRWNAKSVHTGLCQPLNQSRLGS